MSQSVTERPLIPQDVQSKINSSRRWQYGAAALQHFSSLVKVAAYVGCIFMAAHGFHQFHLDQGAGAIGREVAICTGMLALGYGAGRLAQWAKDKKKFFKAGADNRIYQETGQSPQEETSKVEQVVNRLLNIISGGIASLRGAIHLCPSKGIILSANHGKWGDIALNDKTITCPQLTTVAARHGIVATPTVETDPYGDGVCFGACLIFAKNYFSNGQNWQDAAKENSGGAPHNAIVLQEQYAHLGRGLWKAASEEFFNSAYGRQARHETASAEMVELAIPQFHFGLSKGEAIDKLMAKPDGVYKIGFDVHMTGIKVGGHAVLLIKKGDECVFFDPNDKARPISKDKLREVLEQELPAKGAIDICKLESSPQAAQPLSQPQGALQGQKPQLTQAQATPT